MILIAIIPQLVPRKSESDIKIICEVDDGRKTVEFATKLRPDVVVMDIAMSLINGIEATQQTLPIIATRNLIEASNKAISQYLQYLKIARLCEVYPSRQELAITLRA